MRHRLFIPAATALLFALTACTQDELADDNRLPEGKYPVVIRTTGLSVEATPLAAPSTRATVDGDWQGVSSVALKLGDAVKEYTVTASTDFKSATLSRENAPHYWTSRDPITVSAWWPFNNANITQMPAVKVAEDQSKLADFQNSDFISAENRKVEFNNPTLEFNHRTARVAIELKPGKGFTSVDGATVSLVSLSADNGNPTAIKTYNANGNTYEALTAPQTVEAGKPFIRVELGGGTFYFRPQNNVVLEAGNRYKYTVKVNASGLTLEGCTIGDWADGGGESGEAEDLGYSIQDDGSYMVYNADGLLAWNKAAQKDESINCTLTADIDLTGKEWTQVGTWPPGYSGIFNGQGHRITGLNFSAATTELFGLLNERSSIADLNYGSITACWFNGTLEEYESGAIVRHNYAYITSCYWGGNAGQGVFSNLGGKVDATKVDGATVKWQTAVDGMNTALTNNDYQWALGTDGLPVLQKRQ